MGTLINSGAIFLGSLIGLSVKNRLPKRLQSSLIFLLGFVLTLITLSWFIRDFFILEEGTLQTQSPWVLLIALILGTLIGEWVDLDAWLKRTMNRIELRFKLPQVGQAFLSASLLFMIGSLAILGPLTEALTGDINILILKSLIDGVAALLLTTSLGYGVLFSSLSTGLYQGLFFALGLLIRQSFDTAWIDSFSLVGHVILIALGLQLMEIKTIKPVNMLPSLIVVIVIYYLF